ncbi:MAG: prenyltransferase [Deltaproteobacteria bacterium]|nr:prenyltransferase [Candidatus Zymogenaceae bacterium]
MQITEAESRIALIVRAVRVPFFTATLVPISIGAAEAARQGRFDIVLFLACLIGGVLFQASSNVLNDYFDHRGGTDTINRYYNTFSGGSRLIQEEKLSPKETLILGSVLLCVGMCIGIGLTFVSGPRLLIIGGIGVLLVVIYSIDRVGLAYIGRGLGELAIGLGFGPVMILGTCYVLTCGFTEAAWWLSIPTAILIILVLYINGYPDYDADRATGKKTLPVTLGRSAARFGYALGLFLAYAAIVVGVVLDIIPTWSLLALIPMPLAFAAVRELWRVYDDPRAVVGVCAKTILIHLTTGLLIVTGLVLDIYL